ncbi:MAG TPA: DUF805 domain-containing protein [Caulobacteraceae bacterium]|jgi:uncharacterized membrane protein YhaH (DUF805 family)|nr:DUF805 domain-containing protein [Caulobacteraceae bacterium]
MDIKNLLFSYNGRIRRLHYWMGVLGLSVGFGILFWILFMLLGPKVTPGGVVSTGSPLFMPVVGIIDIALVYMSFAIYVKRAHDRGRAWWFALLFIVPLLNLWPFIELGFLPGTAGPNQYGPDPKLGEAAPAAA